MLHQELLDCLITLKKENPGDMVPDNAIGKLLKSKPETVLLKSKMTLISIQSLQGIFFPDNVAIVTPTKALEGIQSNEKSFIESYNEEQQKAFEQTYLELKKISQLINLMRDYNKPRQRRFVGFFNLSKSVSNDLPTPVKKIYKIRECITILEDKKLSTEEKLNQVKAKLNASQALLSQSIDTAWEALIKNIFNIVTLGLMRDHIWKVDSNILAESAKTICKREKEEPEQDSKYSSTQLFS